MLILLGLLAAPTLPTAPHTCSPHYEGEVKLSAEDAKGERILQQPLGFVDARCNLWSVPAGIHTDGASIPGFVTWFVGDRWDASYLPAALIHDWYCDRRTQPWQAVHRMFFEAMIAHDVPQNKARLMYAGVYLKGPRWTDQAVLNNNLLNSSALPSLRDFNDHILQADRYITTRNNISFISTREKMFWNLVEEKAATPDQIDSWAEQVRELDEVNEGAEKRRNDQIKAMRDEANRR